MTSDCSGCPTELFRGEPVRATGLLGSSLSTSSGDSPAQLPAVLGILSSLLERIVECNECQPHFAGSNKLTVFHGLKAPMISIDKYLERIHKYANCSPSCFVVAYAYIDRLIQRHPDLPITSLNVHRLLVTSIMVAAKFLDDAYFNNAYYAKVGGVTTGEMNRLELEFLFRLDFRLHVTTANFGTYCAHLEHQLRLSQVAAVERPLPVLRRVESFPAESGMQKRQALSTSELPHAGRDVHMYNAFDVHTPPREAEFYGPPGLVDRGQYDGAVIA
eukprot:jgi/Mesen1/3641/ME000020S03169